MRAAVPSARTDARRAPGRPPAPPTPSPESGSRSAAPAGVARTRPLPPAAGPVARADTKATRSSGQPPPELLEPVALCRQDDVLDGQAAQFACDTRTVLRLDCREAVTDALARRVDL